MDVRASGDGFACGVANAGRHRLGTKIAHAATAGGVGARRDEAGDTEAGGEALRAAALVEDQVRGVVGAHEGGLRAVGATSDVALLAESEAGVDTEAQVVLEASRLSITAAGVEAVATGRRDEGESGLGGAGVAAYALGERVQAEDAVASEGIHRQQRQGRGEMSGGSSRHRVAGSATSPEGL